MLLTLPAARVAAQDPPSIPLTTDTAQYCAQLAQQITERHSSRPEVARLLADGRGMCEQGVVRSGLRRLRRALVILDHDRDRPSQADPRRDMSADPMPH
jgi:hypothetical protein